MDATTCTRKIVAVAVAVAFALGSLAFAAPADASYGWPLKPFSAQHPIRGYFGDPRIAGHDIAGASIHFGIDISGPDGAPVYATIDGVASLHPLHRDTVIVSAGSVAHEYWHVIPSIRPGQRVVAFRTIVGRIEAPWGHVHFSERHGSTYVNPLRRGALDPYSDRTRPTLHALSFERDGTPIGTRLAGIVDLVAEAFDTTPLVVPAPWKDKPVAPALVEWRLVGGRGTASARWHVAADFRNVLPARPFQSVYAKWTRQNHPWGRGGSGRYRFYLAHGLDTHALANGRYTLIVRAADTAGNAGTVSRTFTVENGV